MRALLVAALLLAALPARAQEVLFLVRHAEKVDNSRDAALSVGGAARAQELASTLQDAGVKAIFTTEFQRTKATAQPLADALQLKPVVHAADDTGGLVALLRKEHGRVLVVGHSNTLPEIAAAYGVKLSVGDEEYDGLFVIVPATKTMLHLHQ